MLLKVIQYIVWFCLTQDNANFELNGFQIKLHKMRIRLDSETKMIAKYELKKNGQQVILQ